MSKFLCKNSMCSTGADCNPDDDPNCYDTAEKCRLGCDVLPLAKYCAMAKAGTLLGDIPGGLIDLDEEKIKQYNIKCDYLITSGMFATQLSDGIIDFGSKFVTNFVEFVCSGPGLEFIAYSKSLHTLLKILKNDKTILTKLLDLIEKNLTKELEKDTGEAIAKYAVSKSVSETATLLRCVRSSISELLETTVIKTIAASIGAVFSFLEAFSILGMIIDQWDPCELNQMVDPGFMKDISDQYNNYFKSYMNNGSVIDHDLNNMYIYKYDLWPQEFILDDTYVADAVTILKKEEYYDRKFSEYSTLYIKNYATNLNIVELNPPNFTVIRQKLGYRLANGNTVVANFLSKYWPWILLGIFMIIFLIIFLIKKNNVIR